MCNIRACTRYIRAEKRAARHGIGWPRPDSYTQHAQEPKFVRILIVAALVVRVYNILSCYYHGVNTTKHVRNALQSARQSKYTPIVRLSRLRPLEGKGVAAHPRVFCRTTTRSSTRLPMHTHNGPRFFAQFIMRVQRGPILYYVFVHAVVGRRVKRNTGRLISRNVTIFFFFIIYILSYT